MLCRAAKYDAALGRIRLLENQVVWQLPFFPCYLLIGHFVSAAIRDVLLHGTLNLFFKLGIGVKLLFEAMQTYLCTFSVIS